MREITGYGNGATIQPLDSGKSRGASGASEVSSASGEGSTSGTYNASSSTFGANGDSGPSGASGADDAKKARLKELKSIYDAYLLLKNAVDTARSRCHALAAKSMAKEGPYKEYEQAFGALLEAMTALSTYEDEHRKEIDEYKNLAGIE